jgi:integrase
MVDGQPRYDVRFRDPTGRQRKKTFIKNSDATRFSSIVEADKYRSSYLDPNAGRILFRTYAEQWLMGQKFEATTREGVELRLRLHIYPVLGDLRLDEITPTTIRTWMNGLSLAASNSQRVVFANVSSILTAAVDDGKLAKNPCKAKSVKMPKREMGKVVPWTAERVTAVHGALPERYRILAEVGVGLGLRQGEIFGLSADDFDFERKRVTINRQVKVLGGNKLIFGLPKGNKTREVPLPDAVAKLVKTYIEKWPSKEATLPWMELDGDPVTVSLILTTRESGAVNRNYFNPHVWHKALRAAGVPVVRQNGCHAMRHHYASVLLDAGESILAVSEYLGHADPGFTLRVYTHLLPSSDERTRNAVDGAFTSYKIGHINEAEPTTRGADDGPNLAR